MTGESTLLSGWLALADVDIPAVHDRSGVTSFRQAVDLAERVATGLLDGRDSLDGERVALLLSPGIEFVGAFFGVLRAGGVVVVLSTLHPQPETQYFCDDAGVRTILVSRELTSHVGALKGELRILHVAELRTLRPRSLPVVRGSAAALQLYTSGTTGKPKGAVITHDNLATQQRLLGDAWGWQANDVLLHMLPLHHMHGLAIAWLSAVGAGATTRFVGPFDASRVWDEMAEASVVMAVPTIHAKLFAAFDAASSSRKAEWERGALGLRLVTSGSAALPVTVGHRWSDLTNAYPLERFGMTEIGVGTSNPLEPALRRPGTVGVALPTVETRIVDDELWVAGPSVFAEYHCKPEATLGAFVVEAGTRWFRTGDTVARDDDGYIRILGRTSVDILKSGGYKLSALEIEEVLREHPAVLEVAVVGLPDPTWGDRVVACVVARPELTSECTEDSLRGFARERLAAYKVPRTVVMMRELPRNPIGKVVKPTLVAELQKTVT